MRTVSTICSVAMGISFLAATVVQARQMGDRQDWKVRKLNRLVGETCEEEKKPAAARQSQMRNSHREEIEQRMERLPSSIILSPTGSWRVRAQKPLEI